MLDRYHDRGRYQIIGEHGRGGIGHVLRAHDRYLGRDVAIKELISRGHVREVRFLREALITAHLEHPGIVPVHEAGRWPDGTPFYTMKLVSGRSLRELIAERRSVEGRLDLLHHVIAVADAIAYAHRRGIIHRDLKPANVIAGEFGETIVIDWGIAKDLAAAEESTVVGAPFRVTRGDGLTATGAVLGTPRYMAPEQERGEHVDQRADVFAIGAMLWELCAAETVPPAESRARRDMLGAARIDEDLATIIDKALDPDLGRRYPDAGALASDLRAFKSGARIAARRYSLFAMLAHWTRRHRALTLSVAAAVAIAVIGVVLYVRNIAVERDRADAALAVAESARAAAIQASTATEAALADQTLKHAELLLSSDPSAALDVLAGYRGDDRFRLSLLRTEAQGRGVARVRAAPHTGAILWARGLANESVATRSSDGTIALTSPAGAVTVIARDAGKRNTQAYAERRRLFAYVCHEQICLVDFSRPAPVLSAPFGSLGPFGLAFAPSEAELAAVAQDGTVTIWDVSDLQKPVERSRRRATGWIVNYLDDKTLAVADAEKIAIASPSRVLSRLELPDITTLEVSQRRHVLAVGVARGAATLIDATTRHLGRFTKLCPGPVSGFAFVPDSSQIAYGCLNGVLGMWDPDKATATPLASLTGSSEYIAASSDGQQLIVGGSAGVVSIVDLGTHIVTSYLGHNVRISVVAAPDAEYPYFVSTDVNGHTRVWPRRRALARVALRAAHDLMDMQLVGDPATAIASSAASVLHVATPRGGRDVGPHDVGASWLEASPDGTRVASFGFGGKIEIWSGAGPRRTQVIETHQAATLRLKFLSADDMIFGGNDGRVLRWSASAGLSTVATLGQSIATFVVSPRDHSLGVELSDGALWSVTLDGTSARLSSQIAKAGTLQLSRDGHWLATGNSEGVVVVYDTRQWRPATTLRASGAIRAIAFSPKNDVIAVATSAGAVHLGHPATDQAGSPDWDHEHMTWSSFDPHPRDVAFSPDGDVLVIACGDGVVWFYSVSLDRWLYYPTGIASIRAIRPAADGHSMATSDSAGRVMMFDLRAVGEALRDR
ncbi:MAG TPA: serine/threonine-protein kinase [Kofleriaceae bacterium]